MKWEMIIGVESHIQLLTKSKIFNGSSTKFGNIPNTQASAIDLALPGTLPTINKKSIKLALKFGIAISAKIASHISFSRKNYFYPDLPKGYQITQYENPIIKGGKIIFFNKNNIQNIELLSAHLEEDAGKIFHKYYKNMIGIDYNRAGNTLLEIITKPTFKNSNEVISYLKSLHNIITWLNISDGNLENGSFRSDINISLRPYGKKKLGIKCEIKNLNSFKFIKNAIEYEYKRQKTILEKGEKIIQETRLYDSKNKKTKPTRLKINEKEYKYFPDPDLPKFKIPIKLINKIKKKIPKLPFLIQKKIIYKYNISIDDAIFLTYSKKRTKYFIQLMKLIDKNKIKLILKWLKYKISFLTKNNFKKKKFIFKPKQFSILLKNIINKNISEKVAKEIFNTIFKLKITKIEKINNLINSKKINLNFEKNELKKIINNILIENPNFIKEIKSKKNKIINFIIGKVLKITKNKILPQKIKNFLKKKYFK